MSEKTTQKSIKEQISSLKKRKDILRDPYSDPEYARLMKLANERRYAYYKEVKEEIENIEISIKCAESDLKALKNSRKSKIQEEITEDIEIAFKNIQRGIDYGYSKPRISWISKDKRWFIFTTPGGTAGTGTPMGTGGYYYSATTHELYCIDVPEEYPSHANVVKPMRQKELEGRLTKAMIKEFEDYITEYKLKKSIDEEFKKLDTNQ